MAMLQKFISVSVVVIAACVLSMGAAYAQAPEVLNPPIKAKAKKKSTKSSKAGQTSKAGKAKFVPGSQETTKERSSRLQRECKGAPNAGACSGYAS
jgi:hypothetical protein